MRLNAGQGGDDVATAPSAGGPTVYGYAWRVELSPDDFIFQTRHVGGLNIIAIDIKINLKMCQTEINSY
jgi:hypothetical protein